MDHLALDDGSAHSVRDWEAAAAAVLRKAGRLTENDADDLVWTKLARTTLEGIAVSPLGTPALVDDLTTAGRPTRTGAWDVRSHLSAGPDAQVHDEAIAELENGATSLWLRLPAEADLTTVLAGVFLDLAPVQLDATDDPAALASAFLAHTEDLDLHTGTNLGVAAADATADLASAAADRGVLGFVVDATVVHDDGASDAQELAWSLAEGAAYLRRLTGAGLDLEQALGLVEFRYAATDEQFPTIAKLRAARRLWARVAELSGAAERGQRQHAVTSRPMMSSYDPWVNLLRTTVAAFAAGVGGADAVTVLPFDTPLGRPDAFGRRLARNTSSLLVAESHVAAVSDPAGGAYAVERLTDDLAKAAWAELGRIEDEGAEAFAARVAEVREQREQQVATRKRPLTGLSEFPNLHETLPEREPDPSAPDVRRYGAAFEELRSQPSATPVFLATMGPVASYTARATFASNLLAAGGVDVAPAGATDDVRAVLAAYDGQPVACLAGHDRTYGEWGADLVTALREAGATWVVVAGKPDDLGVDDSAATGVDALAFLRTIKEKLA